MSLFAEQFPVVFQALNEGFLQTLKLFFITLAGAIPLGLVICLGSMSRFRPLRYLVRLVIWVVRGTPLMLQLLIIYFFPGLVLKTTSGVKASLGALPPAARRSFSTTPAIFPRSIAAASSPSRGARRRLDRCSA